MRQRTALCVALATISIQHLVAPVSARAYSVALQWIGGGDAIAGYRIYVRAAGGDERPPIDVPSPRHDGSGQFKAVLSDLDVTTTYTFTMSAYDAYGAESDRSNAQSIGYAQAATVVDSDYDGLTDAAEDRDLDMCRTGAETDRLKPDTDGDGVPDGLEVEYGSDPLTAGSPTCASLDTATFRPLGAGTASIVDDGNGPTLMIDAAGQRGTSFGVMYPANGKGAVTDPLLVVNVRTDDAFRIEVRARSTAGQLYRMRFLSRSRVVQWSTRRRMTRALGDSFTVDHERMLGFDIAAEMQAMDPSAVFGSIERVTVRGEMLLGAVRTCR
jgi:hypothetical protein